MVISNVAGLVKPLAPWHKPPVQGAAPASCSGQQSGTDLVVLAGKGVAVVQEETAAVDADGGAQPQVRRAVAVRRLVGTHGRHTHARVRLRSVCTASIVLHESLQGPLCEVRVSDAANAAQLRGSEGHMLAK